MHGKDEKGSRGKAFRNACRRPKHRHVVERVDLLLRDKHDKMDEMFKVMVPMSTSKAKPYIARNISEESVCRTLVELQAVLFSSSSISILSSIEEISMASRSATRRAHLLSPSLALTCAPSANTTRTRAGARTVS